MPQSPSQVYPAVASGVAKPLNVDALGNLLVSDNQNGELSTLNITSATVVKTGAGYIARISVTTAGAAGAVYDFAATSGQAAANLIAVIPASVGVVSLNFPVTTGILIVTGAAQVVSVTYR
jgi:hypothetical protein